jgi:hypothetical protein
LKLSSKETFSVEVSSSSLLSSKEAGVSSELLSSERLISGVSATGASILSSTSSKEAGVSSELLSSERLISGASVTGASMLSSESSTGLTSSSA